MPESSKPKPVIGPELPEHLKLALGNNDEEEEEKEESDEEMSDSADEEDVGFGPSPQLMATGEDIQYARLFKKSKTKEEVSKQKTVINKKKLIN